MSVSRVWEKNYLADKKPYWKHFRPGDISITAVRSVAIQGLMVFNGYVASLELEDSDDDETSSSEDDDDEVDENPWKPKKKSKAIDVAKDEFECPTLHDFSMNCTKSFVKSLSISTYVRSLEELALRFARPQLVGKLVKDVSKSATRKYLRTHSRFTAARLIVRTGMRANFLGHIAIFLVEETQQILLILYRKFTSKAPKKLTDKDADKDAAESEALSFARVTARNASRSGLAVITGGLGAALGTLVRPGVGTVIGGTLGDTIAYVL